MARPRSFVRFIMVQGSIEPQVVKTKGMEAHGVSLHAKTDRFYIIDDSGQRQYFRRLSDALIHTQNPYYLAEVDPDRDYPWSNYETKKQEWDEKVNGKPASPATQSKSKGSKSSKGPTLKDCLKEWTTHKEDRSELHVYNVTRYFNQFIKAVGNLAVSSITKETLATFEKKLKGKSNRSYMGAVKSVKAVLTLCIKKTNYPFPDGLLQWLFSMDTKPVVASASNKEALPVDQFQQLIQTIDRELKALHKSEPTTAQPIARKLELIRHYTQLRAILFLSVNCAFDAVDIERITVNHIKRNGSMTFVEFPRYKSSWKVGIGIDRKIPLHAETLKALNEWLDLEPATDVLFRSKKEEIYSANALGQAWRKLKKRAGLNGGFSFKHIRNIAPTIRRNKGLPFDMSDTILGHTVKGMSRFYTGDADETYLLPLVNAIGDAYFAKG